MSNWELACHRGYLFYGPPGTGKTSLVSALAAHFALSIYVIQYDEFNDRSLMKAVNQVPANSVLLFEDIDCIARKSVSRRTRFDKRKEWKLDGGNEGQCNYEYRNAFWVAECTGRLSGPERSGVAMTTNRVGKLDTALLRPGRIDYKLFLGRASDQQKMDLYRRIFPSASNRKRESSSMLLGPQKRWLSFKACSWLWSREKVAWIKWWRVTESWRRAFRRW